MGSRIHAPQRGLGSNSALKYTIGFSDRKSGVFSRVGKSDLIAKILEGLKEQFERMKLAATDAKNAATDEDSRAESKYDTRGLEASYLAAGQAEQAEELAESIQTFEGLNLPNFEESDAIEAGALVEADLDGELVFYLLAPGAGGFTCEYLGCDLTVLAPGSPLRNKLEGRHAGDVLDSPAMAILDVS